MLNAYLEFGMGNWSENFMAMSRCYACAGVIFVDFLEHLCWCTFAVFLGQNLELCLIDLFNL